MWPTNVVTMVMKLLHNSCNIRRSDLTDMYALILGPVAWGRVHTYQSNHLCTCYNFNMYVGAHYSLLIFCLYTYVAILKGCWAIWGLDWSTRSFPVEWRSWSKIGIWHNVIRIYRTKGNFGGLYNIDEFSKKHPFANF